MVTTAESNRVSLKYVKETTEGATPTSPVFRGMRITAAPDFGQNPKSEVSTELRYDRQVTNTILTNKESGGSVNWELSYKAHDDIFEGSFANSWDTTDTPEIANTASDTPISDVSSPVADSVTITVASGGTVFKKGHLVLCSGFTNAANNGLFRVNTAGGATTIIITNATGVAESTVPATARIKVVGFRNTTAKITATAISNSTCTIVQDDAETEHFHDFLTTSSSTDAKSIGTWVYVTGFTGTTNDGWCRISAVAEHVITFDRYPSTWVAIADGTGQTVDIYLGDRLRNGVTKKSYTLEETFTDLNSGSGVFQAFRGVLVNTTDFRISSGAILTGSFNFFGRTAGISTTRGQYATPTGTETWYSGQTDVEAYANDVFNATSNVADIREGTTILGRSDSSIFVMEASFQMNNNLRRNNAIGVFGAANVAMGELGVSGSMNMYFSDISIMNKLLNQTESSFSIKLMDNYHGTNKGQVVIFDMPRIKYTSGNPSVSGKNTDVMVNMGFQAIRDATLLYTMMMQRFDYVDAS